MAPSPPGHCYTSSGLRLAACFLLIFGLSSPVNAAFISLDPTQSGEIERTALNIPGPLPVTVVSYEHRTNLGFLGAEGNFPSQASSIAGYAVYDLSSIGFVPISAAIELDIAFSGEPGELRITDVAMFTANDLLTLATGTLPNALGESLFNDLDPAGGVLDSGASYVDSSGLFGIPLSAAGLSEVTTASPYAVFGFNFAPDAPLFATSSLDLDSAPRLVLERDMTISVPLPTTLWLLLLPVMLLLHRRK